MNIRILFFWLLGLAFMSNAWGMDEFDRLHGEHHKKHGQNCHLHRSRLVDHATLFAAPTLATVLHRSVFSPGRITGKLPALAMFGGIIALRMHDQETEFKADRTAAKQLSRGDRRKVLDEMREKTGVSPLWRFNPQDTGLLYGHAPSFKARLKRLEEEDAKGVEFDTPPPGHI